MQHVDSTASAPTPAQIRAGRALLDWSMFTLAREAAVSVSTVKRFENEHIQRVTPETLIMMRDALARAGVVFLANDGEGEGLRLNRVRRSAAGPGLA